MEALERRLRGNASYTLVASVRSEAIISARCLSARECTNRRRGQVQVNVSVGLEIQFFCFQRKIEQLTHKIVDFPSPPTTYAVD